MAGQQFDVVLNLAATSPEETAQLVGLVADGGAQTGHYGVREEAELLQNSPDDASRYPTVTGLRANLTQLVHQHGTGIAGLDEWSGGPPRTGSSLPTLAYAAA